MGHRAGRRRRASAPAPGRRGPWPSKTASTACAADSTVRIEVGAGVPVGDRIDVDRVDLLAGPAQRLQGESAPGAHRGGVERRAAQRPLRDAVLETARPVGRQRVHRRVVGRRAWPDGRTRREPW